MRSILSMFSKSPFKPLASHMGKVRACVEQIKPLFDAMENKDDELRAGWLNNRVIRVTRRSPSAGIHVAYRLVVEGN